MLLYENYHLLLQPYRFFTLCEKNRHEKTFRLYYCISTVIPQVVSNGMSGSAQHVECSRVLVVACQKRQAYLEECSRLNEGRSLVSGSGTSSVLTLSGVRLALKATYLQRIRQQQQIVQHSGATAIEQHHFLCMLRLQDGRVHATEVTSTGTNYGPAARDFVEIPTCLTVKDLPQVSQK